MSLARFYICPITQGDIEVTGPEIHHMTRVMRLGVSDRVELFDGHGRLAVATITAVKRDTAMLWVQDISEPALPAPSEIIIAASVAKKDRFDWLISQCTELGVDRICPTLFERTVKQPKNPNIVQRYNTLAITAAKQCRRLVLPQIDPPRRFADVVATVQHDYPGGRLLAGSLESSAQRLTGLLPIRSATVAFVGPEGGMTDEEREVLERAGALETRLTDSILRIEAASVAFAAILSVAR
ncbi:MAG: 16S rRNA (uracil(1498)-N(3))-methyltransferase [Phycisphaerae bacterium]|nr:16S rRNA (uracil(1498)-N(3))-methyltransferase [Phycisphaerae bacterium]